MVAKACKGQTCLEHQWRRKKFYNIGSWWGQTCVDPAKVRSWFQSLVDKKKIRDIRCQCHI